MDCISLYETGILLKTTDGYLNKSRQSLFSNQQKLDNFITIESTHEKVLEFWAQSQEQP